MPTRAAVERLVNAEICGVIANRHQVSDSVAHPLNVTKLQVLGARNNPGFPRGTAIRGNDVRAAGPCRPYNLRVYRAYSDEELHSTAELPSETRLVNWCRVLRIAQCYGAYKEEGDYRTLKHKRLQGGTFRDV